MDNAPHRYDEIVAKRLFDIVVASLLLLVMALPMAIISLLVLHHLGRPVFFRQQRPGQHGRPFTLVKFRTMHPRSTDCASSDEPSSRAMSSASAESSERHNSEDARLDRFGRALRASALDELPELWNVLKGEMSLVGPRPLLMDYLPLYSPEQARRHEVRPGLTGWAQVNGRNRVDWEERLAFDVWYVDHRSIGLDLRILAMTIGQLLRPREASPIGRTRMRRFQGSPNPPAGLQPTAPASLTRSRRDE